MKLSAMYVNDEWQVKNGRAIVAKHKNLARAIVMVPNVPVLDLIEFAKTVNHGIEMTVKKLLL